MESVIHQRIRQLLKEKETTVNALADGNNALQRKLQRQINEGSTITSETLAVLINAFPSVNPDWLLGCSTKKERELDGNVSQKIEGDLNFGNTAGGISERALLEMLEKKDQQIEFLQKLIADLRAKN